MNKDTQYEIYTKRLYQTLTQAYPNVQVLHNQKISGNQIDVCWKHNIAGVDYLTLVECKNYNKSVDLNCYRQLVYNMDLLKARGVLVTTVGFQLGVIEAAKCRPDVKLLKVTFETSPGETLEFGMSRVNDVLVIPDLITTTPKQISEWKKLLINNEAYDLTLHNSSGEYISTVNELVVEIISDHKNSGWVTKKINDTYIKLTSGASIKLDEIQYEVISRTIDFGCSLHATKVMAHVHDILNDNKFTCRVEDFF